MLDETLTPFVKVDDLKKSFGSLDVLRGVSFSVQKGEYIAIMGSSGSGKTTLLQLLGILDKPDSGEITINGKNILSLKDKGKDRFRNHHIGFVFQFHELLPEFTALENVALPALIKGTPMREALSEATRLLDFLSLRNRIKHKPDALSGGEKQRVAVARALINKPDLLLADEPSGSLDEAHKEDLHQLFEQVQREYQQTMIVVTHDASLALRADRVLRLEKGLISSVDKKTLLMQ